MKKSQNQTINSRPKYAVISVIGVALAFAGFATFQMVSAQTGSFSNPNCNPVDDPGACNPSSPLFLNPNKETTVVTPTTTGAQLVRTPLQLGYAANGKTLDLFGNANLQPGAKIQTQNAFSTQAINVTSTGDTAIIAASSAANKAAIQGNGQSGRPGLWATSDTGSALLAQNGASGYAGQFEGPVMFYLRSAGATDTSKSAMFSVDNAGNLDITTSVAGKGLTINGIATAGAGKAATVTGTNGNGGLTTYDIKGNLPGGGQYAVTSIQVLYMDTASADRHWKPLATTAYVYKECTGSSWVGSLEMTNPVASPSYRISYQYDPTATFNCTGQDTTPPPASFGMAGVVSGWWYGAANPTVSATPTDPESGISKVEFYDRVAGQPDVLIGSDSSSPYSVTWNVTTALSTWQNPANTHTIVAKAFNGANLSSETTSPITNVKTFLAVDNRFTCSNTITCTLGSQSCCTATKINDGNSICKDTAVSPPVCVASASLCGACTGGHTIPPVE